VFGFRYPFETEPITVADFANLAQDIDTAQDAMTALALAQTLRPIVQVQVASQSSATGVATAAVWDTLASKITDPTGMFNPGTPNLLTVRVEGVYLITAHSFSLLGGFATVDVTDLRLTRNSTTVGAERSSGTTGGSLPRAVGATLMWPFLVGDTITATFTWVGTGGPAIWSTQAFLSASYVCPLS
jgi:hypothetical protein